MEGRRELTFSLPASAGTDLRFEIMAASTTGYLGRFRSPRPQQFALQQQAAVPVSWAELPRIVEQLQAPGADGQILWTLKLDRRWRGDLTVTTRSRQPRGKEATFPAVALTVVGASRQSGFLAVEATGEQRMKLTAVDTAGHPLPLVDVVDFPISQHRPQGRIVASVRYLQPGFKAEVSEDRFDRESIPTAVCHRAIGASLVDGTGERHHQLQLDLVAVGVQSLQLQFGPGETLLSALVDGVPVEVRTPLSLATETSNKGASDERPATPTPADGPTPAQTPEASSNSVDQEIRDQSPAGSTVVLIPLTAVSSPTQHRDVQLLYQSQFSTESASGSLTQSPPALAVVTGEGVVQPLDVLEWSWTIHHPKETRLLGSEGGFHPTVEFVQEGLLSRLDSLWGLPNPERFQEVLMASCFVLFACLVLWVVFGRFGLRGVAALGLVSLLAVLVMKTLLLSVTSSSKMDIAGGASVVYDSKSASDNYYGESAAKSAAEEMFEATAEDVTEGAIPIR